MTLFGNEDNDVIATYFKKLVVNMIIYLGVVVAKLLSSLNESKESFTISDSKSKSECA